jgi:hypothetical protein
VNLPENWEEVAKQVAALALAHKAKATADCLENLTGPPTPEDIPPWHDTTSHYSFFVTVDAQNPPWCGCEDCQRVTTARLIEALAKAAVRLFPMGHVRIVVDHLKDFPQA